MKPAQLAKAQEKADENMRRDWKVENGLLVFDGTGYDNLCTEKQYGDFEMYVDWMLDPKGPEADAGIYLRGTPQVQIWDTSRVNVGAQVGSGGLYNNQVNESKPSKVADNKLGEWNSFYIKMVGDRVTVVPVLWSGRVFSLRWFEHGFPAPFCLICPRCGDGPAYLPCASRISRPSTSMLSAVMCGCGSALSATSSVVSPESTSTPIALALWAIATSV